jgi:hypothetical protein
MSVIRMGSTNTYSSGWDVVFGSGKVLKKSAATKPAAKANAKAKAVPVKAEVCEALECAQGRTGAKHLDDLVEEPGLGNIL